MLIALPKQTLSPKHFLHILQLSLMVCTSTSSSLLTLLLMSSSKSGSTFHKQQQGQQWHIVNNSSFGLTFIQTLSILFLPITWLNPNSSALSTCAKASSTVAVLPYLEAILLDAGPMKIQPKS